MAKNMCIQNTHLFIYIYTYSICHYYIIYIYLYIITDAQPPPNPPTSKKFPISSHCTNKLCLFPFRASAQQSRDETGLPNSDCGTVWCVCVILGTTSQSGSSFPSRIWYSKLPEGHGPKSAQQPIWWNKFQSRDEERSGPCNEKSAGRDDASGPLTHQWVHRKVFFPVVPMDYSTS